MALVNVPFSQFTINDDQCNVLTRKAIQTSVFLLCVSYQGQVQLAEGQDSCNTKSRGLNTQAHPHREGISALYNCTSPSPSLRSLSLPAPLPSFAHTLSLPGSRFFCLFLYLFFLSLSTLHTHPHIKKYTQSAAETVSVETYIQEIRGRRLKGRIF